MNLTPARAEELLARFADQRVLVLGDLMLDRYIHGKVDRISPEAPVPVVRVLNERDAPGGASNVAMNIQSLGAKAVLAGVIGTDKPGDNLVGVLNAQNVDTTPIVRSEAIETIVKTRILAHRQQICRVDLESDGFEAVSEAALFEQNLDGCNGVILEDYGKGVITPNVVETMLARARDLGIPSGFDPKDNHEIDCSGVTVATPNRKEAFIAAGMREERPNPEPLRDAALLEVAQRLLWHWGPDLLMITLGPHGILLAQRDLDRPSHVPTRAREVFDVSGAGDTVIAAFVTSLAAGATPIEAAELANVAAGIVVGKLGTATCTQREVKAVIAELTHA